MKKLKPNQLGPWCSYCPAKTTRAAYKQSGYMAKKHCCAEHIPDLQAEELADCQRDGHLTEADYQTWMRL